MASSDADASAASTELADAVQLGQLVLDIVSTATAGTEGNAPELTDVRHAIERFSVANPRLYGTVPDVHHKRLVVILRARVGGRPDPAVPIDDIARFLRRHAAATDISKTEVLDMCHVAGVVGATFEQSEKELVAALWDRLE